MTKDIDHILTEFDEEGDKAKAKKNSESPESLIESAFDDQLLNPDPENDLPSEVHGITSSEIPDDLYSNEPLTENISSGEFYETELPDSIPSHPEKTEYDEYRSEGEKITGEALSLQKDDDLFIPDVPGTRSWNTRQPYRIEISKHALEKDMISLESAFYVTKEKASHDELSGELKRALLMYLKKNYTSMADNYREMVNRVLINEGQELLKYFNIGPDKEKIFMYHMGISTVYSIVQSRFKKNGIGYCYRYGKDGKAQRFFPEMYLKNVIADWYHDNIYNLSLPFDSLQIFDSIKNSVSKLYIDVEKEFRSRLEKINTKVEPSRRITGDKLMKLKGGEWYDVAIIAAYKRFVGRTIFN